MFSYGLMLHHFCDDAQFVRGQGAISGQELADIIDFLGPKNFLTPQEWSERALVGRLEPFHRCITLDDSLRCQFDIALPVFDAYGLKAFWFVYSSVFEGGLERTELFRQFRTVRFPDTNDFYTAFFDRLSGSAYSADVKEQTRDFDPKRYLSDYPFYTNEDRRFRFVRDIVLGPKKYFEVIDTMMFDDQSFDSKDWVTKLWMNDANLRQLDGEGHAIGMHSYSHPTALSTLDEDAQRHEYSENARHLSKILGAFPRSMSHPLNSYNSTTLKILSEMGVTIGFRDNLNRPSNETLLEMPREDHANILARMHS